MIEKKPEQNAFSIPESDYALGLINHRLPFPIYAAIVSPTVVLLFERLLQWIRLLATSKF